MILDDDERRDIVDPESGREIGALRRVDTVELEGAVIMSALEHLGEESLDPAAVARRLRGEEDEPRSHGRPIALGRGGRGTHLLLLSKSCESLTTMGRCVGWR